jgi:hypothetical protein
MLEHDEKRDFKRMQTGCRMSFKLASADHYRDGICINISGSGILFRTDVPLEPSKAAEVHIAPENRLTPPLTAYVEVIRCDPIDHGRYEIAGAIKGIKSE